MADAKLEGLKSITQLAFEKESSELAKALQIADELRSELANLSRQPDVLDPADTLFLSHGSALHERWKSERKAILNSKLALAMADVEKQKQKARRAFGKRQVVLALIEQSKG